MQRKIIVTGTSCTGKTTLGRKLAKELGITQIDLDDLHFLPNWVEKENDCLLYTSPSPRDQRGSRMPSSA